MKRKILFITLIIISISSTTFTILKPFYNSKIIDNIQTDTFYKWIILGILIEFLIKIQMFIIRNLKVKSKNLFTEKIQFDLIEKFCLKTKSAREKNNSAYEIIKNDSKEISSFYTGTIIDGISLSLKIIFASIVLAKFNFVFFICVFFLSILAYFFHFKKNGTMQKEYEQKHFNSLNEIDKWIDGLYKCYSFFSSSRLKEWAQECYHSKIKTNYKYRILQNTNSTLFYRLSNIPIWVIETLIYIIGGIYVIKGNISLGGIVALIGYNSILQVSLKDFLSLKSKIMMQKNSFERIKTFENDNQDYNSCKLMEKEQFLIFKNVSFFYSENKILKDVSFELPLHGIILIQGENGQGKSTLLKLIKGDLKPNEGQIFFDGKIVSKLLMYEAVSQVSQSELILNDTYENNICFLKEPTEKAENLFNEIVAIKNSKISDCINETTISGGEKKRLLIARAMFNQKKIFIFDEADTGMDIISFNNYMNLIQKLALTNPVFLISHHNFTEKENIIWNYRLIVKNGTVKIESERLEYAKVLLLKSNLLKKKGQKEVINMKSRGYSMLPTIPLNSNLTIEIGNNDYQVNDIILFLSENSFYVHRIINIKNDTIECKGDNNELYTEKINLSEIIGIIIDIK